MSEIENNLNEQMQRLGLAEAMVSFEGTALAPLIEASLTEAGINPNGYDPAKYNHANYCGLLATEVDPRDAISGTISPIVSALNTELNEGRLQISAPELGTVRLPSWSMHPGYGVDPYKGNAWRSSKLNELSMRELKDVQTGRIVAYVASLGTDGGRPGFAILSTNDVLAGQVSIRLPLVSARLMVSIRLV